MHPSTRHRVATFMLLVTCGLARPTAAAAQTVTLPTVRATGPGPEEAMLRRLVHEVRLDYEADSIAAIAAGKTASATQLADLRRARLLLPRLDRLTLSSVTYDQLLGLAESDTLTDSLQVLAGERYMPDDPEPIEQQQIIDRLVHALIDKQPECAAEERSRLEPFREKLFVQQRQEAMRTRTTLSTDTLTTDRQTAFALACVLDLEELSVPERLPGQLLASIESYEVGRGRTSRAAKLDSLKRVAVAVVVLRKLSERAWFPVRNREHAAAFWRQRGLAPLNVGSIAGSGKAGVAFTELASPLLKMFRVSVNAVLAAQEADGAETDEGGGAGEAARRRGRAVTSASALARQQDEAPAPEDESAAAIQRLLTGGGLFNVSFAVPVHHYDWSHGDVALTTLFAPRFGLTAPVLGAKEDDANSLNADVGIELHAKMVDLTDGVGLIGQFRLADARGSQGFIESVGVPDKHHLAYGTASFGFLFGKQYLVTASRAVLGPASIRRSPWQVGLTVVRQATAP